MKVNQINHYAITLRSSGFPLKSTYCRVETNPQTKHDDERLVNLTTFRYLLSNFFAWVRFLPEIIKAKQQELNDVFSIDGLKDDDFGELEFENFTCKEMRSKEFERDRLNNVIYMSKEQRKMFKLSAINGQLYRNDGMVPLDTVKFYGNSNLLYVVSKEGKIYALSEKRRLVHHSSFLSGHEVIAAGEIRIRNGKVIFLNNDSGHYRPGAIHLLQAIRLLHDRGVLSPEVKISFRHRGEFSLKEGVEYLKSIVSSNNNPKPQFHQQLEVIF